MSKMSQLDYAVRTINNACHSNNIKSGKYIAMIFETPLETILDMIIDEAANKIKEESN
jgi:hypothetical protein